MTENEVKKIMTPSVRDKDQLMRFNKAELALLKAVFADNEDLLFAIRKVLLQFPINEAEQAMIKGVLNEQVYALIKKFFLPELDPEAPLFQLTDMINTLSLDMKAKGVEEMKPLMYAKVTEIAYLDQQLKVLKGDDEGEIRLSKMVEVIGLDEFESYVNITTRNYLLSWVDSNIQQMKFLAGKKEETVEDTLTRLAKNSSK